MPKTFRQSVINKIWVCVCVCESNTLSPLFQASNIKCVTNIFFMAKHHPFICYLPLPNTFRWLFSLSIFTCRQTFIRHFHLIRLCLLRFSFSMPLGAVVIDSRTVFNIQTTSIFRLNSIVYATQRQKRSIDRYMQNYNKDDIIYDICWIAHSKVIFGLENKMQTN